MKEFAFPTKLLAALTDSDGCVLSLQNAHTNNFGVINGEMVDKHGVVFYRCVNGIMLHTSITKLDSIMKSELDERDRQSINYDERLDKRYHKEIKPTVKKIKSLTCSRVIEYGCGTGRFTSVLASVACEVLAVDFSLKSLYILQKKLLQNGVTHVGLVQADVTNIVTADSYFSCAVSFQVYEHVPYLWQRQSWLQNIHSTIVLGGSVYMTLYHQDIRRRFTNKTEVGYHDGGIFYRFYHAWQLRSEVFSTFGKVKIGYIAITLPGEHKLKIPKWVGGYISFLCSCIPGLRLFAHLLTLEGIRCVENVRSKSGVSFLYPSFFFTKHVSWFGELVVPKDADVSTFFSYELKNIPGFRRKVAHTTCLNLQEPEEKIWSSFRKKFIRQQIKKGERNGIVVRTIEDWREVKNLYKKFRFHKRARRSAACVFVYGSVYGAYDQGRLVSAGVFFDNGEVARAHVLMSERYNDSVIRERVGQANRMLIWEVAKRMKSRGIVKLDLGGINIGLDSKEESSLTIFKEAFGGKREKQYYYTYVNNIFFIKILKIRKFILSFMRIKFL